jgi:Zn-dependent protease
VGFALALVFLFLRAILFNTSGGAFVSQAVVMAISAGLFINFFWTILNLMPVMPLDGGQVLRELLGPGKARVTAIVGAVTGGILAVFFLLSMQPFIAILFGVLAYQNYTRTTPAGGVGRR